MVSNSFRRIALAQGLLRKPPPPPDEGEEREGTPPRPKADPDAPQPAKH